MNVRSFMLNRLVMGSIRYFYNYKNLFVFILFLISIYVSSWRWNWQLQHFDEYVQITDLRHFYYAGRALLDGVSPYLSNPVPGLEENLGFNTPFFYPPYTLPIFSIISLFPINDVKYWLFLINYLCFHSALFMLLKIAIESDNNLTPGGTLLYLFQIFVISSFFWWPVHSAKAGNLHSVFFLCAIVFVYSGNNNKYFWQFLSLIILLFKPQYGLPFLIIGLLDRKSRNSVLFCIIFMIVLMMLTIYIINISILDIIYQYVNAVEIYRKLPYNNISTRIGQIAIFQVMRWDFGPFVIFASLITASFIIKIRGVSP